MNLLKFLFTREYTLVDVLTYGVAIGLWRDGQIGILGELCMLFATLLVSSIANQYMEAHDATKQTD